MKEILSPNVNFQVVLDAVGFVQGVTLGLLLIILNRRKYRSSFFLGLFLMLFSLEMAFFIFVDPEVAQRFPELYLPPFHFSWLLIPLFFLYTQQVSILADSKVKYWLLYPGIASFILQTVLFTLPFETKQAIYISNWYELVVWEFGYYYSWIIGIYNLRLLYKHRIEVKNTYSYITFKELQWARIFLIYLLISSMFNYVLSSRYTTFDNYKVYLALLDLLSIYLVTYFGIVQRNIQALSSNEMGAAISDKNQNRISREQSFIPVPDNLNELIARIDSYMNSSTSFRNPNLTIGDLATALDEHPRRISSAINTVYQQNFNSYVNKLRVRQAMKLINSKDFEALTLEGIGNEAGFRSKSAFYTAFKRETGQTPKNYKSGLLE